VHGFKGQFGLGQVPHERTYEAGVVGLVVAGDKQGAEGRGVKGGERARVGEKIAYDLIYFALGLALKIQDTLWDAFVASLIDGGVDAPVYVGGELGCGL